MWFCNVIFFNSKEMKQKKSKHGFVLRQVVLKNVSGQMVSASVSVNEMFSFSHSISYSCLSLIQLI